MFWAGLNMYLSGGVLGFLNGINFTAVFIDYFDMLLDIFYDIEDLQKRYTTFLQQIPWLLLFRLSFERWSPSILLKKWGLNSVFRAIDLGLLYKYNKINQGNHSSRQCQWWDLVRG